MYDINKTDSLLDTSTGFITLFLYDVFRNIEILLLTYRSCVFQIRVFTYYFYTLILETTIDRKIDLSLLTSCWRLDFWVIVYLRTFTVFLEDNK